MKPQLHRLEQRFVFDGAVAAEALKVVSDIPVPDVSLLRDTGNPVSSAFSSDRITNNASLAAATNILSGNQELFRVSKDGVLIADWQTTYNAPKADGSMDGNYEVQVKQVDGNGNQSGTEVIDFTLDSSIPATPQVDLPAAMVDGLANGYATDLVTTDASINLLSAATEGTLVEYRLIGNSTDTGWQTTYKAPANDGSADGVYALQVRQTDLAGNVSNVAVVDFTLHSLPSVPHVALLDVKTGGLVNGYTTDLFAADANISPAKNANTSNLVEYRLTSNNVDTGWQANYVAPLTDGSSDGVYTLQVRQTDTSGFVSNVESITFTLDSSLLRTANVVSSSASVSPIAGIHDLSSNPTIAQHANQLFGLPLLS